MNTQLPIHPTQLPIGSILSRAKAAGFIAHKGLYLGNNQVLHNVPGKGDHISPLQAFSAGQRIDATPPPAPFNPSVRLRAERLAAKNRAYCVIRNNCEHTIRKALGLRVQSPQLQFWTFVGGTFLACQLLSRPAK